jgi:hypothetical protein
MMATSVILRLSRCLLAFLLVSGYGLADASAVRAETINWPIKPLATPHPLGNSYGEYQYYGGSPYYHPGIDVMGAAGDSVFAVKAGYVKAVLTTSASLHWRVAVGDSAAPVLCDGYLYAHLALSSIQVAVGDTVADGQYLGQLVAWPVAEFHHLHFVKIRQESEPWSSDWMFIHNPLDYLVNINDIWPPEFVTLGNGSVAAFYPNNGSTYFAPGDTLSGAVDFLVSVRDIVGAPEWYLTPYQVAYRFRNDSLSYPSVISVQFRDTLWWAQNVDVIYRDDAVYDSKGDYDDREYYVICTNTDGDEYIEAGDADSAWFTGDYPNGNYWLQVSVIDRHGNRDDESLQVVLHNPLTFQGTVTLADQPPSHAGTRVHLPQLGLVDTTDAAGAFALPNVGPGTYEVRVERTYYDSVYTTELLTLRDQVRNYTLQPMPGLRGDVDHDDDVDAADILLLVSYIFRGGPAPDPLDSGDVDGMPPITSADVIYLVNYVFKGGPPPPPL